MFGDEFITKLSNLLYWAITALLALAVTYIAGPREEFKLILYGIIIIIALFIWLVIGAKRRHIANAAVVTARQEEMLTSIRDGFDGLCKRVDNLYDAQQSTMRTQLIHYAEKYLERGWLTPEERQSWRNMWERYSELGANGFIDGYKHRLELLPDKDLDTIISSLPKDRL